MPFDLRIMRTDVADFPDGTASYQVLLDGLDIKAEQTLSIDPSLLDAFARDIRLILLAAEIQTREFQSKFSDMKLTVRGNKHTFEYLLEMRKGVQWQLRLARRAYSHEIVLDP